ncbi:MAG: ankyrin repeat domain-containing protein [Wolbachia sp.]
MTYSSDDIKELYQKICQSITNSNKYGYKITSLEDLQKEPKWKEVNFQDECEGGHSLGDLLLKHATENNNSRVKGFLLKNGCKPLQQEQITAAINKEEEAPNVEENRADSNEVDSSNSINPGMTAEVLYGQLIQGKETNSAIFDSFANAVRESNITGDRGVFLDVIKLFTDLDSVIHLTDTASRTILDIAAITKQADVVKILLSSDKFNEEEKFNALRLAIIQGNVQEAELILGYVSPANMQKALEVAIQENKTDIVDAFLNSGKLNEENRTVPSVSNENVSNKPMATVPPISTKKTNPTTAPNNGNGGSKPVSPVNTGTPAMLSGNDKSSNTNSHCRTNR